MNEFFPQQEVKLELKIVEKGLVFLFQRPDGGAEDTLQVPQNWASVHTLLSRLRKGKRYCAKDHPLLVWQQGEELHVKFYSEDSGVAEECSFSSEETRSILTMLDKLPSWN